MTESNGGNLSEEPQEERGEPGSRDNESGPQGQQADRPVGTSDADDHTGVDPQDAGDGASTMQTGDGG